MRSSGRPAERDSVNLLSVRFGRDGLEYGPDRQEAQVNDQMLEPVLTQWVDEGYATHDGVRWLVPWDAIYEILQSNQYGDVVGAAGFPNTIDIAPRLVSR